MKNLKLIGFLMILASSLMFIQCTSDPIAGPQGLAGADGIDGIDGVNGVDGVDGVDSTASCVACHSDSHRDPIEASYKLSLHAMDPLHTDRGTGDQINTSDYTNRQSCAQCHTSEGYIDYVSGFPIASGDGYPDDLAYAYGKQTISCNTCHNSHSSFDFDTDGQDFALRNFDPVTLIIDGVTTIDMGTSNNCATCHQPRQVDFPAGIEDVTITSSRYGPHHGPQSTVVEGIFGANIAGSVGYPGVGTSTHRTGASCVSCHMGETTDGTDGLHSWHPTENTCLNCHVNGAPTEVSGYAEDFQTLHDLLVAAGSLTESGSTVPGTFSAAVGQATWNYKTLEEDKSNGIHNPGYAKALLKNSIEALQ
ncbi:hypothetical protein BX611_1835 [Lutibacter oceani]|uniref:Outer membrane cytochrome MtrC/MtrF-like domain-containing protein n=1 Tax=Lutibacter oceani TaxID=1853311 RepID=A0A3D9RS29_9FLAO|nr:hypothetical protein [Lutibacter oceani]REE82288.1 hypothetical protein BX611_1835 [Lutibacter oceani]